MRVPCRAFNDDRPRLPIGHFFLNITSTSDTGGAAEIVQWTQRVVLWNATLVGKVVMGTPAAAAQHAAADHPIDAAAAAAAAAPPPAACEYTVFASADYNLADVIQFGIQCTGGAKASLTWVPELAVSTWAQQCPGYVYNPAPVTTVADGIAVTTQMHLAGTEHAVAFGATPHVPITPIAVVGETGVGYATAPSADPTTFHITVASVSKTATTTAKVRTTRIVYE